MNINVKNGWPYKYAIIADDNASINLGPLDEREQKELAREFIDAASDLLCGHSNEVKNKLIDILNENF